MATIISSTPHNVQTTLNYYGPPIGDEEPYHYVYKPPEGVPMTNVGTESHPATINDIRGKEDTVGLDKSGFQFVKHVSEEKDFLDEELIKTRYYKEIEELLKKEAGAKKVFIFDHTIRYVNDTVILRVTSQRFKRKPKLHRSGSISEYARS